MIATLRTIIQAVKEQNQADAKRPRANSAGDATSACVKFIYQKDYALLASNSWITTLTPPMSGVNPKREIESR